jgi:hypothetical protein
METAATDGVRPASSGVGFEEPVGWTGQYSTTVDPTDYEDDAAAIQALVDDLFANMGSLVTGHLYLPQTKADGSSWSFPRTVSFGSDADRPGRDDGRGVVLPHGRNSKVESKIDDGSPVFHLDPANVTKFADSFGGFRAHGKGNDSEFVRITSVIGWELRDIWFGAFATGPESTGAIVADANSYNFFMNNIQWWGGGDPEETTVVGAEDTRGVNAPVTDGHLMLDIHGECAYGVNNHGVASNVSIGGHLEGATKSCIKWTNARGPSTKLLVTDETWFWNTGGNHLIHVDNCMAVISSFYAGVADEDLVRIGPNMKQFHVAPFVAAEGNFRGGDTNALSVAEGAGTRASTVPYPEQLPFAFDVTPLVGNENVRFPNGMALAGVDTIDVPAGGSRTVTLPQMGTGNSDIAVKASLRDEQTGPVEFTHRSGLDADGTPMVRFRETTGENAASLSYRIFQG